VSTLRAHLWREWREHRLALGALAVLLPLALTATAFTLSRGVLRNSLFPTLSSLFAVLAMLLAVGGELLGERRGPGLRWLERLPGGLAAAFRAKLVFFAGALLVSAGYGYCLAAALARLRGVGPLLASENASWFLSDRFLFLAGAVIALWTFACSAWALRGGLSLLAAGLFVCALGYPYPWLPSEGYLQTDGELRLTEVLLLAGGLLAARAAFVTGSRTGRNRLASTLFGLGIGLPLLAPIWGWALLQLRERSRFDPTAEDFSIEQLLISTNGARVFLTGRNQSKRWTYYSMPKHALAIDLQDGRWQGLGEQEASFLAAYPELLDATDLFRPERFILVPEGRPASIEFDARTGEQRTHQPDGWPSEEYQLVGLGGLFAPKGLRELQVYDCSRQRIIERVPVDDIYSDLIVRPGRWLFREHGLGPWFWFDPDDDTREPTGWSEDTGVHGLLPDGRLLLLSRDAVDQPLRWFVLDPEAGTQHELQLPATDSDILYGSTRLFEPGQAVVLDNGSRLFLLDLATLATRPLDVPRQTRFLRTLDDGSAIVLDEDQRFVRLDLASGERRVLFPPEP
jgi:hypothetical protein